MYYKPDTQEIFKNHSEIRKSIHNVMFEDSITEDALNFIGVFPVVVNKPDVDLPSIAVPTTIENVDGVWTQMWTVREATQDELNALKPPVPEKVSRRQARQALLLNGLLDAVPLAIDAIPDETQRALARIEWEDSLEFDRSRDLVNQIGAAIGLDDQGLDDIFIFAATL